MNSPLLLCGPACAGTNLVKAILGVHPEINLESEPYLPIFRSLRNSIVSKSNEIIKKTFNPDSPMNEYYFFDEKIKIMDLIQNSNLNINFEINELEKLKIDIIERSEYVPHLTKYLNILEGKTYKKLFISALKILSEANQNIDVKWNGWLDSWIEEFFPLLAYGFNDAKFILIFRDPRAVISSSKRGFAKENSGFEPLTLSFLRCWRKQVAFTKHFQESKLLKDRVFVVRYEDIVEHPEKETRKLCNFLEVEFSNKMLDTNNFKGLGYNTNKWEPSLHWGDVPPKGIYKDSLYRWKEEISDELLNFTEFIVGPDLKYLGYKIDKPNKYENTVIGSKIYKFHKDEHLTCKGWRTDNNNPEVDISLEILRHQCLNQKTNDQDLIRRCFLFPEIYHDLYNKKRIFERLC